MERPASERVFETHELAELIFFELSFETLLTVVSRTCRQWLAVVDSSKPLQQVLFQQPIKGGPLRFYKSKVSCSSLLANLDDGAQAVSCSIYKKTFGARWVEHESEVTNRSIIQHPLLNRFACEEKPQKFESTVEFKKGSLTYKNASWKRQLATQPPIKRILVKKSIAQKLVTICEPVDLPIIVETNDIGLRLGDIGKLFTEVITKGKRIVGQDLFDYLIEDEGSPTTVYGILKEVEQENLIAAAEWRKQQ